MADLALPDLPRPLRRTGGPLRALTAAGWATLALAVTGLGLGLLLGYAELLVVGLFCALLLGLGLVAVRLPVTVRTRLALPQPRTVAGRPASARVAAAHAGRTPLTGVVVEVPVTPQVRRPGWAVPDPLLVRLPTLPPGREVTTGAALPALPRGVHTVGPARIRRTDPLGLVAREVARSAAVELHVRPETVPVEQIAPGHVRDLEGRPSDEISMSDLAFHALREYVPGDDLRHVHWRSSARVQQLHVRQYHDTRRSHAVVAVDDDPAAYRSPRELELALSLAASVVVRLGRDDYDLTFLCGGLHVTGTPERVLDATCRARLGARAGADRVVVLGRQAARLAPDASLLVLVTGSGTAPREVPRARTALASDVRFLGLRAALPATAGEPAANDDAAGPAQAYVPDVLTVPELAALPRLLGVHARGVRP